MRWDGDGDDCGEGFGIVENRMRREDGGGMEDGSSICRIVKLTLLL